MSNNDNQCKDLPTGNREFTGWDEIFKLQYDIQTKVYGHNFKRMSLNQLANYFILNKHCLEDELGEMMDALGGINDGIGNAVWKPWKKDHQGGTMLHMGDMTEGDKKELLMEIVDAFHFMINFAISTGFTGSDVANAYIAKNKENIDRQKRGY